LRLSRGVFLETKSLKQQQFVAPDVRSQKPRAGGGIFAISIEPYGQNSFLFILFAGMQKMAQLFQFLQRLFWTIVYFEKSTEKITGGNGGDIENRRRCSASMRLQAIVTTFNF
jgi:hypothetical protein